ncbi:lipoprotein insertase outer membrane protein LolB [Rheinheimera baltica]|uniref:Outer-membrane lipoprotein LolB n=1 Tax=Rheinheimera baltica TaxID=67576 RepID=A0ABT9HZ64_9GAMM|nr:lipoprotein insertase outer membrane protein LolB [Rheinheimera baltica]MDP5136419.1 lipoprotein insertase outer membrane protein LolB [Rheinheimera baltica]
MYEKALTKKSTAKDFSVGYSIKQLFIICISLYLLTGCSLFQRPTAIEPPLAGSVREQQLIAMQNFTLQASIGIKTQQDSISGNLTWQQQDTLQYQARLSNGLGISLFALQQKPFSSELTVKGETYQAADADTLLLQLTGLSMPLADMPLWLRGLPGNNSTDVVYDTFGRVTRFNLTDSSGVLWQLEYQSFFADALALPKRLRLTSSDTQIKVVIRSWQ